MKSRYSKNPLKFVGLRNSRDYSGAPAQVCISNSELCQLNFGCDDIASHVRQLDSVYRGYSRDRIRQSLSKQHRLWRACVDGQVHSTTVNVGLDYYERYDLRHRY